MLFTCYNDAVFSLYQWNLITARNERKKLYSLLLSCMKTVCRRGILTHMYPGNLDNQNDCSKFPRRPLVEFCAEFDGRMNLRIRYESAPYKHVAIVFGFIKICSWNMSISFNYTDSFADFELGFYVIFFRSRFLFQLNNSVWNGAPITKFVTGMCFGRLCFIHV